MSLPDFLIVGAPKAGSTALHDALARHPQLYASPVKEPKYFMCDDARPSKDGQRGPGDAHSAQEWVWRRTDYERLFAGAPAGTLSFESTPFYLWDKASHERIASTLPDVKLIAVIRDPVDRAYSNWTHLWADGLETEPDFLKACLEEPRRIERGWAPFWRYLDLGRYGEQLQHLYRFVDPARVHVVRYRQLVDSPGATLDEICRFLGIEEGHVYRLPDSNLGRWSVPNPVNSVLRVGFRAGAAAGAYAPPKVWRQAQRPLLRVLQRGRVARPTMPTDARSHLVGEFSADNALLCELLRTDYSDWLGREGRGTYTVRKS